MKEGYFIIFDEEDMNGIMYTKESYNPKMLENMKAVDRINDFKIDNKGVWVSIKI